MTILETGFQSPMKKKKNHRVQHDYSMAKLSWVLVLCLIDMSSLRGPSLMPVELPFKWIVTLVQGISTPAADWLQIMGLDTNENVEPPVQK